MVNISSKLEKDILSVLIDKYESLILTKGGSNIPLSISISFEDFKNYNVFQKLLGPDRLLFIEDYLNAFNNLKSNALINYICTNNIVERISLSLNNIDLIYKILNRPNPKNNPDKEIEIIESYLKEFKNDDVLRRFLLHCLKNLREGRNNSNYYKTISELESLTAVLSLIISNKEEIFAKKFSKKYFKNQNYVDNKKEKLFKVFNDFSDVSFGTYDELLNFYFIKRSSYLINLKGNICFKLNKQKIDLEKLNLPICLDEKSIWDIEFKKSKAHKVIIIENLSVFKKFKNPDFIAIYIGKNFNIEHIDFVKKINCSFKEMIFYHFADIDPEGFRNFTRFEELTGLDFIPYGMSEEEIIKYQSIASPLLPEDRKNLEKMLKLSYYNKFYKVINFMLANNLKLELEFFEL